MITRRSIPTCVILSIVTCGVYGFIWLYHLNSEVHSLCNEQESTSGGMLILLTIVTCNVYGWFWGKKMGEKLAAERVRRGIDPGALAIMCFIFSIVYPIVAYCFIQNELNRYAPEV